jgi:hypothetical protein
MRKINAIVVLALSFIAATSPYNANALSTDDDIMLAMVGEFQIGDEQTSHPIADNKSAKHYRICTEKVPRWMGVSDAVQVRHDGAVTSIAPGNCVDVEGAKISIAVKNKLPADTILIGRYQHIK